MEHTHNHIGEHRLIRFSAETPENLLSGGQEGQHLDTHEQLAQRKQWLDTKMAELAKIEAGDGKQNQTAWGQYRKGFLDAFKPYEDALRRNEADAKKELDAFLRGYEQEVMPKVRVVERREETPPEGTGLTALAIHLEEALHTQKSFDEVQRLAQKWNKENEATVKGEGEARRHAEEIARQRAEHMKMGIDMYRPEDRSYDVTVEGHALRVEQRSAPVAKERLWTPTPDREEIRREIYGQIDRYYDLKGRMAAVDSLKEKDRARLTEDVQALRDLCDNTLAKIGARNTSFEYAGQQTDPKELVTPIVQWCDVWLQTLQSAAGTATGKARSMTQRQTPETNTLSRTPAEMTETYEKFKGKLETMVRERLSNFVTMSTNVHSDQSMPRIEITLEEAGKIKHVNVWLYTDPQGQLFAGCRESETVSRWHPQPDFEKDLVDYIVQQAEPIEDKKR
jgi:hypothetical protein